MAWNRFVDRYRRAIDDERFLAELGPIPAIQNAVLFHRLLLQLVIKRDVDGRWLTDPDRTIRAQVALWTHLWGTQDKPGLFAQMDPAEKLFAEQLLEEADVRGDTLRILVEDVYTGVDERLHTALTVQLKHMIASSEFGFTGSLMAASAPVAVERTAIVAALSDLLAPRDLYDLARYALGERDLRGAVHWERAGVPRQDSIRPGTSEEVDVLVVHREVPGLNHSMMESVLARLLAATQLSGAPLDYLRIKFENPEGCLCFWDARASRGLTSMGPEEADDRELVRLVPEWPVWSQQLDEAARVSSSESA